MIKSTEEMLRELNANSTENAKKGVYETYDCGPDLVFDNDGITVNSIVEGSCAEVSSGKLFYPIEPHEFWDALDEVEAEATYLWKEANGEEESTYLWEASGGEESHGEEDFRLGELDQNLAQTLFED